MFISKRKPISTIGNERNYQQFSFEMVKDTEHVKMVTKNFFGFMKHELLTSILMVKLLLKQPFA
jgi:hypothetical protein